MNGILRNAMACTGAVLGAGFASGREITAFFSRFGMHSWGLIALAALLMSWLCKRCMQPQMWKNQGLFGRICVFILLVVTGGAMTAASGQMIALMWGSEWAYSVGSAGTLMAAWLLSFCKTRVFGWLGIVLSTLLMLALVICLSMIPKAEGALIGSCGSLVIGAVKAAGYAAMNITLASGMIRRCARSDEKANQNTARIFGLVMALMLGASNMLYLRHPQLWNEAFPIVRLLSRFGRNGFVLSVTLLYLAILTTLVAVMGALRDAVNASVSNRHLRFCLALGLPLGLSFAGFSQIVETVYAPAGWLCLFLCFGRSKT